MAFMAPPLPHARESKGCPAQRRIAQAADFAGLLAWRGFAADERIVDSGHAAFPRQALPQWQASEKSALQSRGGAGFTPSSRARGLRWGWRGGARFGLLGS